VTELVDQRPPVANARQRAKRPTEILEREVTYLASWMYTKEPFRSNREDRRLDAWPFFAQDGRLPNHAQGREAWGELDEPIGALAVRLNLQPLESQEVTFTYSWFMPNHLHGHRYEKWFQSAWDVAQYVNVRRTRLFEQTRAWQETVRTAELPEWLTDGLINSLAVYTDMHPVKLDTEGPGLSDDFPT